MVELIGVHRLDEADVIDDLRQVRQHLRQFRPALAVLGELEARPEHGRIGPDEGVALAADDRRRHRLAFELRQLRLVVEQIELARRAGHEQMNDALRLRREVRLARRQRVCVGATRPPRRRDANASVSSAGERDLAHADAALAGRNAGA